MTKRITLSVATIVFIGIAAPVALFMVVSTVFSGQWPWTMRPFVVDMARFIEADPLPWERSTVGSPHDPWISRTIGEVRVSVSGYWSYGSINSDDNAMVLSVREIKVIRQAISRVPNLEPSKAEQERALIEAVAPLLKP